MLSSVSSPRQLALILQLPPRSFAFTTTTIRSRRTPPPAEPLSTPVQVPVRSPARVAGVTRAVASAAAEPTGVVEQTRTDAIAKARRVARAGVSLIQLPYRRPTVGTP